MKTCILCKHFYFDGGTPGYSEYTPGTDWLAECQKSRFSMSGDEVSHFRFVKNLKMAETCPNFERE